MPEVGTALGELLLMARSSQVFVFFLISNCLFNECLSLESLLWRGDKGNVVSVHDLM